MVVEGSCWPGIDIGTTRFTNVDPGCSVPVIPAGTSNFLLLNLLFSNAYHAANPR
jgi:hypothetical protein